MTASDKHYSLLWCGINGVAFLDKVFSMVCHLHSSLIFVGKARNLPYQYQTQLDVTASDKHSSLLRRGVNDVAL
jgi:hypothetical protein